MQVFLLSASKSCVDTPDILFISLGVPTPDQLTVHSVDTTSATVSWEQPDGMDQTQLQYQISYQCPGRDLLITTTSSLRITLYDLQPASEYSVSVCSLLAKTSFITNPNIPHPNGYEASQTQNSKHQKHSNM